MAHSTIENKVSRHCTGEPSLEERGSDRTGLHGQRPVTSRKVLFVTNAGEFGGTEKHLLELIQRLGRSEVQTLILQVGADVYTDHVKGSESLRLSILSGKLLNSVWDWFRFFRKTGPDVVVFVNGWLWSFPWYSSVAACLAGVRRRFAIQHLIAEPVPVKMEGRLIRNALWRVLGGRKRGVVSLEISALLYNTTICVSNAVRDRLVSDYRFPANKTITIHNGVSLSEFVPSERTRAAFRARRGIGSEEFLLVCVARLSEVKGIDTLLLAMARLLRDGVPCKCVIVGDGPLRGRLLEQAAALGLSGHAFFEGFQISVRQYLQAADAFVLTSHREGLPFSILEAMACGLPSVVTDAGGNAEAVTHGVHGLVVAPGSVEKVADAILYLVAHPRERAEMSRMARGRVREVFDVESQMEEIKRVILS